MPVWTGGADSFTSFWLADLTANAMDGTSAQHGNAASAGGRILDGFSQVSAWRGGTADPLFAEGWIDAGATPEAVVFRVGQVEEAYPAFAGGRVKRTGFGDVGHGVNVTEKVPTGVYMSYIVPLKVMENGLHE